MIKFCPECGYKLSNNPKFCPECGHKLVEDKKAVKTTKKDNNKKIKIGNHILSKNDILVTIFILALLMIGIGIHTINQPIIDENNLTHTSEYDFKNNDTMLVTEIMQDDLISLDYFNPDGTNNTWYLSTWNELPTLGDDGHQTYTNSENVSIDGKKVTIFTGYIDNYPDSYFNDYYFYKEGKLFRLNTLVDSRIPEDSEVSDLINGIIIN